MSADYQQLEITPPLHSCALEWIGSANGPRLTRKRIIETVHLAAVNVRAGQWPRS